MLSEHTCEQILPSAGDKAEQLLWRLQNGELPATKHPKVVVVMIGTNGEESVPMIPETQGAQQHLTVRHLWSFPKITENHTSCDSAA